ncbi:MAG: inlJ [Bacteroidota bacterium]|nr:inlJ [Bacteroidota bacterium]
MKKICLFLFVISFLHPNNSKAQFVESEECIGGNGNDIVKEIQKTSDGGSIVVVETNSSDRDFSDTHGGNDIALIKFNRNHEIEWKKCYGDSSYNFFMRLLQDDSVYYLAMYSYYSDTAQSMLINCIGLNGDVRWIVKDSLFSAITWYYYARQETDIFVLKNKTFLYYDLRRDTTLQVHAVGRNGNELWKLEFDYKDVYEGKTIDFGVPKIYFENMVFELSDNTILLKNYCVNDCLFGICGNTANTDFIHIDYDGNIINRNTVFGVNMLPQPCKLIGEDQTSLYFFGGYSGYMWNLKALYALDKSALDVYRIDSFPNGLTLPTRDFLNHHTRASNDYIDVESEVQGNNNNYYVSWINIATHVASPRALLDSISNTAYINVQDIFYLDDKKAAILLYQKDSTWYISLVDSAGNVSYNKIFLQGAPASEYFNSLNTTNIDNANHDYFTNDYLYNIEGDKFYSYFIYQVDESHNTQRIFIHNVLTGEKEFEYINNLADHTLIKQVSPYGDDKKIFVLSDLDGSNSCMLGGYDIRLQQVFIQNNKIYGAAYIDYNNNNTYDGGDVLYNLAMLESYKGNQSVSEFMYGTTYALNRVDTGTWNTSVHLINNYFTVTPSNKVTSHADYNHSDTAVFVLHPVANINDLDINLVNTFITRLNSSTNYEITYSNKGTYTSNGTIKLVLDHRLQYQSANPVIAGQSGDTLTWNFTNLKANEFRKITINIKAGFPPGLNPGDAVISVASILNNRNDTTPSDNQSQLKEVILAAYDPNDKTSNTGEEITPVQIANGEYITYTIRFQNVGTDTAFKVIILDTLDENLDWSTFQMVNASHNFSVQLIDGHILKFSSNNIILPDSSGNENASHGFVAYKVKPKVSLTQGATIKNTAHIYFDFNTPVRTSTVNTRVTVLTSLQHHTGGGMIKVYPNPNSGIFMLEFNSDYSGELNISISDITGRLVYKNQLQHQQKTIIPFNITTLASGLYSIILKTDKEQFTEKIIIGK